jgi:ATP-dependent DNA helicase RecG
MSTPRSYTDTELEAMLADLESDLVERKESFRGDAPNAVREAVCAFANDLPNYRRPGVAFIGATDDGRPSGLAVTDELLRQIADVKTDGNIVPPPSTTVGRLVLRGGEVAVILVDPADSPPVRYRGRVHIRIGPRRGIATAQDERILTEKRRHRDLPFDVRPLPSASLKELRRAFFEEAYLPAAFAPDVLEANDRTYEQRLAATKMVFSVDDPAPTILGALVIGKRTRDLVPGAYIQFLRIDGTDLADPIVDELLIDGVVSEALRRLDDKLIAHNRTAVDITNGPVEVRKHVYPLAALQQLVRSAVMHRSYEATNAPVRVYWYEDRIAITNPGGPYGEVTAETFGTPGLTDYRNPNLAEAMRVLSLVQRFGAGIPIARRALAENGNPPPEFLVQPTYVTATVRPSAVPRE